MKPRELETLKNLENSRGPGAWGASGLGAWSLGGLEPGGPGDWEPGGLETRGA